MKKVAEKVILGLFALIVVIWGSYHLIQYNKNDIKTEAALEYTTNDTLSGRGVVFREEETLPQSQSGRINYLYEDATRVALEEPVAEFYSANIEESSIRRMRELESEIDMLAHAQNRNLNNFSSVNIINRDLRDELGKVSWMASTNRFSSLSDNRYEITYLLNRRHVAIDKVHDYNPQIDQLEAEYQRLKSTTSAAGVTYATAPTTGFFSKTVDGLENTLTPEKMSTMSIQDIQQYINEEPAPIEGYVGKIVTNHRWNMAVALPAKQIENIRKGRTVSLLFDHVEKPVPATIVDIKVEHDNDTAVIFLSSDQMTNDVINLRVSDVQLSFGTYTGLRINSDCFRFQKTPEGETVRGVYVLENHQVKFKAIDPIYENPDFVLSRISYANTPSDTVRLFDQIITDGTFYEGEVIQ